MAGLMALVAGSLGQILSSNSYSVSSTLLRINSLSCPLIASSFSYTIFSHMVYRLLSEWCVATSFYESSENHVYCYGFVNLPNLLHLIQIRVTADLSCPQVDCASGNQQDVLSSPSAANTSPAISKISVMGITVLSAMMMTCSTVSILRTAPVMVT